MGILSTIAQSENYYNTYSDTTYSAAEAEAAAAVGLVFGLMFFIFAIVIYVLTAICLMNIFKKAGVKPWIAWVPFYNNWKLLEIGGQQGFWAVLAIIPFVNIVSSVFMYIAMYHIGLKFGKEGYYVLLAIFVTPIWFILLAIDKAPWNDSLGAPSLAPEAANKPQPTA